MPGIATNGLNVLVGILSDTHNAIDRTKVAVDRLVAAGAEALIHCGDLACPEIVAVCGCLPFYFVFGNHDGDVVPDLLRAAAQHGATCLKWGGEITLAGKRIAVVHGHVKADVLPLLAAAPDYLLTGHSHAVVDVMHDATRRINPGALYRANPFTVALLNLATGDLQVIEIPR